MSIRSDITDSLSILLQNTENIQSFVTQSPSYLEILQHLFSYSVQTSDRRFGHLLQLVVNNLDSETIWEELECRNKPLHRYIKKFTSIIHKRVSKSQNKSKQKSQPQIRPQSSRHRSQSQQVVDLKTELESEEEPEEEPEQEQRENEKKRVQDETSKHEDFDKNFNGDEDENEDEDEDEDGEGMDDFDEMEDEPYDDEEEDGNHLEQQEDEVETPFMKHQKRLNEQISSIEKEISGKKSWELAGEVKSSDRPQNSLLSTYTDVERASKPAPVITPEFTSSIEDLIKRRITNEAFDNIQKLINTKIQQPKDNSNEELLSTEKSSLGLGDIYAQEFTKKVFVTPEVQEKKKTELHKEIIQLYDQVAQELDGLTHFFYTPSPISTDIVIKSVTPISLEEFIPMNQASLIQTVVPKKNVMTTNIKKPSKKRKEI